MLKNDLTLLYVEDDAALREQFMRVLTPRFKEVYEASDGAEALEMYAQYHPDIMLVDINLPIIDGLEVIERVRKSDKETAIVVLSAYSDQEKLFRAVTLGLSGYLIKPIPHKKLLSLFEDISLVYENQKNEKGLIRLQNAYLWKNEEKTLLHNEMRIPLTKREILLLDFLLERRNTIVHPEIIEALIWQGDAETDHTASLTHLIKRLRKKLPEALIENIYGEGYRILSFR
jgi:DNA-binding response OmpR family regulator